jgi:hypothetical protein
MQAPGLTFEPAVSFNVSGPTLTIIVEATKRGFVVLCRSPEDARLMWQAAVNALRGVEDRALQQALYVCTSRWRAPLWQDLSLLPRRMRMHIHTHASSFACM